MTTPVLATKLYIPPKRDRLVSRSRLIDAIRAGLNGKFTLISAPAGFGKTTLLSEFILLGERLAAWVSLDKGDNDPGHFLLYFISALQKINLGIGNGAVEGLQSAQSLDYDILLTGLLNEITEIREPFIIVLDDYHNITDQGIQEMVVFLLENQPPQMHLIIVSRADPPWPLARFRARSQMNEIRTPDLRFTREETAHFLDEVMDLELGSDDVAALESRTEGWIVGLQMAALSMQGRNDIPGFLQSFTGSHRFILDYLMEEVLDRQTDFVKQFLLETSILERLNGDLCDAVLKENLQGDLTSLGKSQKTLEYLEHHNIFLVPLDDQRQWYRYHHLFADLLRNRLFQMYSNSVPTLHSLAASWHLENGYTMDAIRHAFSAENFEMAAGIVERNVVDFKDHGELPVVVRWLDAFPDEILSSYPWLCIAKAWALAYIGQPENTKILLEKTEKILPGIGENDQHSHLRGHIAAIRCFLALFEGNFPGLIEFGNQALALIPTTDPQTWVSAATTLASGLRINGELDKAYQILLDAVLVSKKIENPGTVIRLWCAISLIQITYGKLQDAVGTLEKAINAGKRVGKDGRLQTMPVAGHAYIRLGHVLFLLDNLDVALEHVKTGIELSQKWGQANAIWEGYRILAIILETMGDKDGYHRAMVDAEKISNKISGKFANNITQALQAQFWLKEGNLDAAIGWAAKNGLTDVDSIPFHEFDRYSIVADIFIAQGRVADALKMFTWMHDTAKSLGALGFVLDYKIRLAVIYDQLGEGKTAIDTLSQAVTLGVLSGNVRVFIEQGVPLRNLLHKVLAQGIEVDFVNELISAINAETPENKGVSATGQLILNPLSGREMEVLRMLVTDLSTLEIANQLYITVSTARTHIKNIYSKLCAHSRMEAVSRARDLGLV